MTNCYSTVAHPVSHCSEEKKSRFIAQIWPISDKSEGASLLAETKQQWPDARHYCWAYLVGNPQQTCSAGFSDDGEPGGTAGKPMLNVLMQRHVGDVFAIVTRYFGGVKLGAGGLTRAYGQAISGALDSATLRQVVPQAALSIHIDYPLEAAVRQLLSQYETSEPVVHYGQAVTLDCLTPLSAAENLRAAIINRCSGAADVRIDQPGDTD